MITLEQVERLNESVIKAVQTISDLQNEKNSMKSEISSLRAQNEQLVKKVADLQESLSAYEKDKDRIDDLFSTTLQRLNQVEDTIIKAATDSADDDAVDAGLFNAAKILNAASLSSDERQQDEAAEQGENNAVFPSANF